MLSLVLALLAGQDAGAMIDTYRTRTQAYVRCDTPSGDDVTVCGRRDADRYRVPLIEHDAGDPRYESVPAERQRLLAKTTNCEEHSTFLVECGKVGVTAGAGFDGNGIGPPQVRPLAP